MIIKVVTRRPKEFEATPWVDPRLFWEQNAPKSFIVCNSKLAELYKKQKLFVTKSRKTPDAVVWVDTSWLWDTEPRTYAIKGVWLIGG